MRNSYYKIALSGSRLSDFLSYGKSIGLPHQLMHYSNDGTSAIVQGCISDELLTYIDSKNYITYLGEYGDDIVDKILKPVALDKTDFHIFYYTWWGDPKTDGEYRHWHNNGHMPPGDISSDYYPALGAYSSKDSIVVDTHMSQIASTGVGTVILSWWGRSSYEEGNVLTAMDAANAHGLKCGFMIEPYSGITAASAIDDIAYIYDTYGMHPAFYRVSKPTKWGKSSRLRGVFYTYDFYNLTGIADALDGIRGTSNDAIVLANNSPPHDYTIADAEHYDGFYNYNIPQRPDDHFASIGSNLASNNILWSPSVGAGYYDLRNGGNSIRDRHGLHTLNSMFTKAYASKPTFISITSFNEWHEGTQIEPILEREGYKNYNGYNYLDAIKRWTE